METFNLLLIFIVVSNTKAAKILCLYQAPFKSHQIAYRSITEELLKRGHEVIVITTDAAFPKGHTPANMTEIDIHDLSYSVWSKQFDKEQQGRDNMHFQVQATVNIIADTIRSQYKSNEIQKLIKDKGVKFDLIIADGCYQPTLAFTHIYNVPLIQINTVSTLLIYMDNIGVPRHIIYYPHSLQTRIYNLTILELFIELYGDILLQVIFDSGEKKYDKEIGNGLISTAPPLRKLMNNVHMVITLINQIWEGHHPRPINQLSIGDLKPKIIKNIPKELTDYLDSSKYGVIYMSFGTSIMPSTLPPDKIKDFLNVFSQLPYCVLMKWDKDEMPNKPENVRLFKWLPQADILTHHKIKLFITQGGQQSTDEAIRAGVPLICVPMIFDQFNNAERYVRYGIGERLNIKTVTPDELKDTIERVIGNESYRQNIVKLRNLINDKPMSSMDRAMWAIEYVLRHGGAHHMRSLSANMSWAEFFEFELLSIFFAVFMIVLYLVVKFLSLIKRFVSILTGVS